MRVLNKLPKNVKTNGFKLNPTISNEDSPVSRGKVPPISNKENLPISKWLRKRLTQGCSIYTHDVQQHSNTIKIVEYYILKLNLDLSEFKLSEYHQIQTGILFNLSKGLNDNLKIKINFLPNYTREFLFIRNGKVLLSKRHDCTKSCYYFPNKKI